MRTQTTLFTIKTQSGEFHVKPENVATYQQKLDKIKAKPFNAKTASCKRVFPKHTSVLSCTKDYVEWYLHNNSLRFVGGLDGYVLSDTPTVWPNPALDTVEIEE